MRFAPTVMALGIALGFLPAATTAKTLSEAQAAQWEFEERLFMLLALTARDDDRFAIDLLSDNMAGRVCNLDSYASYRGPHAAERCRARDERARIREAVFEESFALGQDTAKLDAQCAAVSEADRRPALRQACGFRQSDLAQAEGERLLEQDTDKVAEACWANPGKDFTMTAMAVACNRYRSAMGGVMHHIVVRDARAYDILCAQQPVTYEDDDEVNLACTRAGETLAEIGALELWKDLPALRRFCATTDLEQRGRAGIVACVWTEFYSRKTPPGDHALEYLTGPMFYDALSQHAVPYARKLVERLIAERGGR